MELRSTIFKILVMTHVNEIFNILISIFVFSFLPFEVTICQNFNELPILEEEGAIKIGSGGSHLMSGTIRWNSAKKDFEGFNGENWISFTHQTSIPAYGALAVSQNEKLVHPDTMAGARFGAAIDIFDKYAIVGSPGDSLHFLRSGAARIFKNSDDKWNEVDLLFPEDAIPYQNFGVAVALTSNFAFVGAAMDNEYGLNTGAVYIYKNLGAQWKFFQKLLPPKIDSAQLFGYSLQVYEETLVVGAPHDDFYSDTNGLAYVFEFDGSDWKEVEILLSNDFVHGDEFGWDVAINEEIIAVSARKTKSNDQGEVIIYRKSDQEWEYLESLTVPTSNANNQFGFALDLWEEVLAIGAPVAYTSPPAEPGSVFIYQFIDKNWILKDHVFPSDGGAGDMFGGRVDLYHDCLVVAAFQHDLFNNYNTGAAYLFQNSHGSWSQTLKLIPAEPIPGAWFGYDIAIWSNQLIIGAFFDDVYANDSGAINIF